MASISKTRSPARACLAEAIDAHNAAADRLTRLEAARDKATWASIRAGEALERAEAGLDEARRVRPADLVAALLDDRPPPSSNHAAPAAERALNDARAARRLAKDTEAALGEEIDTARRRADNTRGALRAAIVAVVLDDPATRALIEAHAEARDRYAALRDAMNQLGGLVLADLAPTWDAVPLPPIGPAPAWAAALAALEGDPDAVLPDAD